MPILLMRVRARPGYMPTEFGDKSQYSPAYLAIAKIFPRSQKSLKRHDKKEVSSWTHGLAWLNHQVSPSNLCRGQIILRTVNPPRVQKTQVPILWQYHRPRNRVKQSSVRKLISSSLSNQRSSRRKEKQQITSPKGSGAFNVTKKKMI